MSSLLNSLFTPQSRPGLAHLNFNTILHIVRMIVNLQIALGISRPKLFINWSSNSVTSHFDPFNTIKTVDLDFVIIGPWILCNLHMSLTNSAMCGYFQFQHISSTVKLEHFCQIFQMTKWETHWSVKFFINSRQNRTKIGEYKKIFSCVSKLLSMFIYDNRTCCYAYV